MQGAFAKQRRDVINLAGRYGTPAILRRADGDRNCTVFFSGFGSVEMLGREVEPSVRRVLVAATDEIIEIPPDNDLDRLVILSVPLDTPPVEVQTLRITEPPVPVQPNGETVYWHLMVRR